MQKPFDIILKKIDRLNSLCLQLFDEKERNATDVIGAILFGTVVDWPEALKDARKDIPKILKYLKEYEWYIQEKELLRDELNNIKNLYPQIFRESHERIYK